MDLVWIIVKDGAYMPTIPLKYQNTGQLCDTFDM